MKYRFYFHYNKQHKQMSVHYRGKCHIIKHVYCFAPCQTKYSTTQPYLRMQGYTEKMEIVGETAYIY